MKTLFTYLVMSSIGLLVSATNSNAANYFNWGVESNTTSIGPVYRYNSGTTRDCTIGHTGSCSMKLQVIGNDGGNGGMGAEIDWNYYSFNIVGGPSIYYRWWMRIEPGFSWGSGTAKAKSSRVLGATAPRGYTGYLMSYGFLIGECDEVGSPAGGGCLLKDGAKNTDSNLYIPYNFRAANDGQWHEYIVRVKPNTSASCTAGVNCDAQLEAWVDGKSVGQYNNFKLHDTSNNRMIEAWGGWMVYPYFQLNGTTSDGGTIYLDDFSTDDIFNSIYPGGGGDTTPPTNVTLTAPSSGATLSGTVSVSGTCSDETGIRGVQFRYGTTTIGAEDTTSPFSVSWDTSTVPNGTYSLTAVCTDNGGNSVSSAGRNVTVNNTVSVLECPANWKTLHPDWIYCDDFDTDKSSLYVDSNYYGTRLVRSSGNGLNSSYSLRSTFPAAPGAVSNGGDFTISFGASPVSPNINAGDTKKYRELYWRAYLRTQPGWQPGKGQKLTRATSFTSSSWAQSMIAHWWGGNATPEDQLMIDPASGVCQGGAYPAGSPSCTNNTVITTGWNDFNGLYWPGGSTGTAPVLGAAKAGAWQCIEGYVKLNDSGQSNGIQTAWVDGVQDATKTGLNFVGTYSTYGINIFRLENYMNAGISQSQYRDWDNLVLSTARIGCSPGGGSTLPAPALLRVE